MGLFDKFKKILSGGNTEEENEFEAVIKKTIAQHDFLTDNWWNIHLTQLAVWTENVKHWPDKKKAAFIVFLVRLVNTELKNETVVLGDNKYLKRDYFRRAYVELFFQQKLVMDDEDAVNIYEAFRFSSIENKTDFMHWPVSRLVNLLVSQRKDQQLSPELRRMLESLKQKIRDVKNIYQEKERIKMVEKIDTFLFEKIKPPGAVVIKPKKFLGDDELARFANPAIEAFPGTDRELWYQLIEMAQKATGAKPSNKYLNETKAVIKELGADKFKKTIHEWMQFIVDWKEKETRSTYTYSTGQVYEYSSYEFLTTVNAEVMKGLVWACSHFHDNASIQTVAALAERSYKKIPGKGPAAASLGNACLYTLYKSKGLDGIGQLSRLKLRIKQISTQAMIDKYLQAAAEEQGVSVGEIEDMAVDDCGLKNGTRTYEFDDYKAELVIAGVGKTDIKWFKPDGSLQKSVPAAVREKHAAKLKKIKDTAKQVEQTLTAQRDRIDRMFRDERKMSWENFKQYYLDHGLVSYLAKSIIWNFHKDDTTVSAIHLGDHWVTRQNEIANIAGAESVSLWHPVQAGVDEIRTWREFLVFHELQQPLKQAYREVYLLTDAEVNTRTYSNRMAAHILRQHQFNSLAKSRSWRYSLAGAFDGGIDTQRASLVLPQFNLRAEYWINEVNADGQTNDTGIWNYVSTDQVRFINTNTNETVELVNIPPLVFSEVMRDVDLFVGVASVGNDPTWRDNGGLPAYTDYWTAYSFGELSEVAKNRKEILAGLVPRLKIKDVAHIKDKFLVVKGKIRTYKIHIGSTNILMEPNNQYLCIVPDRTQKNHTENVFLPFEGDNGLSIILSKAFLLAEDDKITDSTIISQLKFKIL
jgi:hypothetical protein